MLNWTLPVLDINRHRSTAYKLRTQPLKRCLLMNRFIHLSSHSSSFQSNEMCSFNCASLFFFSTQSEKTRFVVCSRRPAAQLCEKCSQWMFFCRIALFLLFAHVDEVHRCCNDLKWFFLKRRVIVLQHILFYLIQEQLADLVAARGQTAPFQSISIKAAIVENTKNTFTQHLTC